MCLTEFFKEFGSPRKMPMSEFCISNLLGVCPVTLLKLDIAGDILRQVLRIATAV